MKMGLHKGSCSIEGCGGMARSHNLCQKHYKRVYRAIKNAGDIPADDNYKVMVSRFNAPTNADVEQYWQWVKKHLGIVGQFRAKGF